VFKEENFEGLFKFGIGSKKGDPTQTGRFGLGFNAVYHITECPMLVSADKLLVLDPQRK
jgi:sacsin